MSPLGAGTVVGVVGAGAMGSGIAQVAATKGHRVVLADAVAAAVQRARDGHASAFAREPSTPLTSATPTSAGSAAGARGNWLVWWKNAHLPAASAAPGEP